MSFRTETEAWNDDTKTISQVEEEIKKKGVTEDNYFSLCTRLLNVENRSSLGARKGNKYYDRMLYCKMLREKISSLKT